MHNDRGQRLLRMAGPVALFSHNRHRTDTLISSVLHEESRGKKERSYLKVQAVRVDNIVIDDLDIKAALLSAGQILNGFPQLRATNAVCTINSQAAIDLDAPHHSLESLGKLLIIALLGRLTVFVLCSKGVLAADDIVQLRRGHVLQIDKLDLCSAKCSIEHTNQTRARGTSVTGKDHTSGVLHVDIDLFDQLIVNIGDLLQWSVGESGSMSLPLSLSGERERIFNNRQETMNLLPTFHPKRITIIRTNSFITITQ